MDSQRTAYPHASPNSAWMRQLVKSWNTGLNGTGGTLILVSRLEIKCVDVTHSTGHKQIDQLLT